MTINEIIEFCKGKKGEEIIVCLKENLDENNKIALNYLKETYDCEEDIEDFDKFVSELGMQMEVMLEEKREDCDSLFDEEDANEDEIDAPQDDNSTEEVQDTTDKEKVEESEENEDDRFYIPEGIVFKTMEECIKEKLDEYAENDEQFAIAYKREDRSFEDCIDYVLACAEKLLNRKNGTIDDEQVYYIAKMYFLDDRCKNIKPKSKVVAATSPTLQKELDKAGKELKYKGKGKNRKAVMKVDISDLTLPSQQEKKNEGPKIFSGLKKGSAEYNKAVEEQTQMSLDFEF